MMEQREVVIIGAGPSGSVAGALLKRRGWDVLVLEGQTFPRFVPGESLLPHCLDFIDEAGMIDAVDAAGFQYKNGAAFIRGNLYGDFDFSEKHAPGRNSTYQVPRGAFDKLLADGAAAQGVEIRYQTRVTSVTIGDAPEVSALDAEGVAHKVRCRFVLDASGFGRVLPRLLDLESPSSFPVRGALVTHVADNIPDGAFDRNKVQIVVHPVHRDVWYWLIPFVGGRASVGCAARTEFLAAYKGTTEERLKALLAEEPFLTRLLPRAQWDTPVREIAGYSANVKRMFGPGYALLGNAAEFLDPIFSSGVTIALRSSSLAASVLDRKLRGETVDWAREFEQPLRKGVDAFKAYVRAWYDGRFQDIMFSKVNAPEVRRMICSILAGYAWDESNPFVTDPERRLEMVARLCAA